MNHESKDLSYRCRSISAIYRSFGLRSQQEEWELKCAIPGLTNQNSMLDVEECGGND